MPCFDSKGNTFTCPLGLTWRDLVSCHHSLCTSVSPCVYLYVSAALQGAAAVSLRGQPPLLRNVHPDSHHHEQHRAGSRGPRSSQCTAQQREWDWHLEFINKYLEGTNTLVVRGRDSHIELWSHLGRWGLKQKKKIISFGANWLIYPDWFRLRFLIRGDSLTTLRDTWEKAHDTSFWGQNTVHPF